MKLFMQREVLTPTLIQEIKLLAEDHHLEITHDQELTLEPDVAHYQAAQEAGVLRVYTVRDADASYALVGYCVMYVRSHPHFKSSVHASQDILYLAPRYRRGMLGGRFINWCDAQLTGEGVAIVYQHTSMRRDFGKLLTRIGYTHVDSTYARRLN